MHACYKLPESNVAHETFWLRDYVTFGKAYVHGYVRYQHHEYIHIKIRICIIVLSIRSLHM